MIQSVHNKVENTINPVQYPKINNLHMYQELATDDFVSILFLDDYYVLSQDVDGNIATPARHWDQLFYSKYLLYSRSTNVKYNTTQ